MFTVEQKFNSGTRKLAFLWLGVGVTTVLGFLYLLMIPWTKGVQPNVSRKPSASHAVAMTHAVLDPQYRSWRESTELSSVIPVRCLEPQPKTADKPPDKVLALEIVLGWFLLSITLGAFSGGGYFEGVVGGASLSSP